MAKDPAFLFYPGDFSTGTQFFSDEQVGKYIRLLMAQHQHGRLSEKQMLHICKTYDEDVFLKFKKDDSGLYYNERLEMETEKRKKYSESRSKNRLHLDNTTKNQSIKGKNISKSYVKHMENENRNKNKDINRNENGTAGEKIIYPFDSLNFINKWKIWLDYRKEISKPYKSKKSEQAALKELSVFDENFATGLIERSIANSWQGLVFNKTKQEYEQSKKQWVGKKPLGQLADEVRKSIEKEYGAVKPG